MTKYFKYIFWVLINYLYLVDGVKIIGRITNKNKYAEGFNNVQKYFTKEISFLDKKDLVFCDKGDELYLQENEFIENKKVLTISPGTMKGFYEIGVLAYIKDNYNLENYLYSGKSSSSWYALFMCYKKDSRKFIYDLLDYNFSQIKSIQALKIYVKYKLLSFYNSDDFDLERLIIGIKKIYGHKKNITLFSKFNYLEEAINCCIASSHIPLITGFFTNRYYNMYKFDKNIEINDKPHVKFIENVIYINPNVFINLKNNTEEDILDQLSPFNMILDLFISSMNNNYIELFDNGYEDAKMNKELIDKIFLDQANSENMENKENIENNKIHTYPNSNLELSKDNDSY